MTYRSKKAPFPGAFWVCKINCVKDNFDVAQEAVASPFKEQDTASCAVIYMVSFTLCSPKIMLNCETVMLQFCSGMVHFFSMLRVARYISFNNAISDVKAPLVLVTFLIWR